MFPMVDCDARVLIDGQAVATAASVGIDPDGNYLHLKVGTKRSLFVQPFTPQMITRWDSAHMKEGVDYQFSGIEVGFWNWGPVGHPGDGEFENWHLKTVAIHIRYSPMCVAVTIRGSTEPGRALYKGMPDPENTSPLPPWNFDVEFSVPKAELKRFLAVADTFYTSFEQRIGQCA